MKRSRLFFSIFTLFGDFIGIVVSFGLAYFIRAEIYSRPLATDTDFYSYFKLILIMGILGIIIFALNGLYNTRMPSGKPYELKSLFMAITTSAMLIIVVDFTQDKHIFPSKSIPLYGWLISLLLVFVTRQTLKKIQIALYKYKIGIQNTLVLGSNPTSQKIIKNINKEPQLGYNLVGILDNTTDQDRIEGIKVLGKIDNLANILENKNVDEIIMADTKLEKNKILEIINLSDKYKVEFKLAPTLYDVYSANKRISIIGGVPIVEIIKTPLDGWGRIAKRVFDISGSIIGLIIFSPILLIISVLIKLTDNGPILYYQKRVGRGGKMIKIYKFRSMVVDAESKLNRLLEENPQKKLEYDKTFKLKDDPRITKIGKFLRRTSLDELPQFINVLKGDMSMVGPRPIVQKEIEKYGQSKYQRMIVKPGITGLWQISGRNDLTYQERAKLDLFYIENWSIFMDIKIILKTLMVFFKKNGAY